MITTLIARFRSGSTMLVTSIAFIMRPAAPVPEGTDELKTPVLSQSSTQVGQRLPGTRDPGVVCSAESAAGMEHNV